MYMVQCIMVKYFDPTGSCTDYRGVFTVNRYGTDHNIVQ